MKPNSVIRCLAISAAFALTLPMARAESAAELIAKGDAADKAFNPVEALQNYLPAEKLDPDDVALLLSIARQYRHLMCDVPDGGDKLKYGKTSLVYAKRAAALAPNNSEAQLSPAITYGKMIPYEGKGEQVAASPLIKAGADRAIKLDPRNDTAWHVLGRWYQSAANISGVRRSIGEALYGKLPVGTYAQAVACFTKAISLNPGRLRHHIELGRTYAQMGNPADARKCLEKGLKMPNKEKDDYEIKVLGKQALADLP